MRLDTHVHLLIDKQAVPDELQIRMTFKYASRQHLDGLCVMEHLDADHYPRLMTALFEENQLGFERCGDALRTDDGLHVYPGAEVAIKGGGDVGVHASVRALLSLERSKGFYGVESLREALHRTGEPFVMVAHHMLLPNKRLAELEKHPALVDAVEVPGKDPGAREAYLSRARNDHLPVLSGSDAHVWIQVGAGSVRIPGNGGDQLDPRARLLDDKHWSDIEIAPDAQDVVRLARAFRARQNLTA